MVAEEGGRGGFARRRHGGDSDLGGRLGNNGGGLPNYYSLVRPQMQQQDFDRQQAAKQQAQGQKIVTLQDEVQAGLTPTGKGAGFMNFGTRHSFGDTTGRFPQPGASRERSTDCVPWTRGPVVAPSRKESRAAGEVALPGIGPIAAIAGKWCALGDHTATRRAMEPIDDAGGVLFQV